MSLKGQERKVEDLSDQILQIEGEFNKATIKMSQMEEELSKVTEDRQ